jgi:hypothetical protein
MGDAMGIKAPVEEDDEKKTQQAMQLGKGQAGAGSGAGDGGGEGQGGNDHGSDDEGAVDYRKSSKCVLVRCIPPSDCPPPSRCLCFQAGACLPLHSGCSFGLARQVCGPHEDNGGLLGVCSHEDHQGTEGIPPHLHSS